MMENIIYVVEGDETTGSWIRKTIQLKYHPFYRPLYFGLRMGICTMATSERAEDNWPRVYGTGGLKGASIIIGDVS